MADLLKTLSGIEPELEQVGDVLMHRDCVSGWRLLKEEGLKAGFDIAIASAYRSFDRQLKIWNEKATGKRAVLDKNEQKVDVSRLGSRDLLFAMLHWSALPGASRHHWGSEIDIYEVSILPKGYQLQLTVAETQGKGVLAPFYHWLDDRFKSGRFCGFVRPYNESNGLSMASEPWHLSFIEVASRYVSMLDKHALYDFYVSLGELELQELVLENFDEVYDCYLCPK